MSPSSAAAAVVNRLKFEGSDAFHKAVKARVEQYFRTTGRRPRDCSQMYFKTAIVFGWAISSYLLLVFATSWWQVVPLAISLGLGHRRDRLQHPARRRAQGLLRPAVGQQAHGADARPDRRQLLPLGPEAQHDPPHLPEHRRPRRRHRRRLPRPALAAPEALRVPPPPGHLPLAALRLARRSSGTSSTTSTTSPRGKIGNHKFPRPRARTWLIFIAGKVVFFSMAFGHPDAVPPVLAVLGRSTRSRRSSAASCSASSSSSPTASRKPSSRCPDPDEPSRWKPTGPSTRCRPPSTSPAATALLCWFLGGLNFQIEHHLFPRSATSTTRLRAGRGDLPRIRNSVPRRPQELLRRRGEPFPVVTDDGPASAPATA